MRSSLFKYFILLLIGVTLILSTCALGAADPVTPDITVPPTLQVTVTVAEDQEASDGQYVVGVITLGFKTNEVIPPDTANFINGESVSCNGSPMLTLGNATTYWFRVAIPYNSSYICKYSYHNLKGQPETATIFSFHAAQKPLLPVLMRPVPSSSIISVSYTPSNAITDYQTCMVQVTANAPNGSATGDKVPQGGNNSKRIIYTGPDVGSLNGLGNIVMTRTCTPINIVHNNSNNAAECGCPPATTFSVVNVTYTSTASYEVSWYPPGSPTQGTNS